MDASDLPHFSIVDVQQDRCTGRFDPSPLIGEGWIGAVYVSGSRFIWGRFRQVDSVGGTCCFQPDDLAELAQLQQGVSHPYLDGYWGERAELVLDEGREWQRRRFEPRNALRYQASGGGRMVTKSSSEAPPGGEIVADGWDHEHCAICWEKISLHSQPEGYFSSPRTWICERCYMNYVAQKSLAFMKKA